MAQFKSYEIANWLDTTPPNVARALLEYGEQIEQEKSDLFTTLRELTEAVSAIDTSYGTSDFLPRDKSRRYFAALKSAHSAISKTQN